MIKTERAPRTSIKDAFKKKKKLPLQYFIGHTRFNSLPELIERYQQEQGGLCCRLAQPSNKESVIQRIDEYLPPQSYEELGFWNIAQSDLTIGKQLGKGSFGEVFECNLISNGEMKLAIKFLKTKDNTSTDLRDEFDRETSFMKSLAHQFVVQLYG